ncbi:hypothetical protein F5Y12DRAFT_432032 [Xylaria sp. FL1777]|nr:hypothetical protein F5Y12DRAFT_432032 [Xylaria sp. FL1777]
MAALTTLFTPPSWCSNRFAVFVDDHAPGTSIIPPSSGWVDPSFPKCIPTQYTTAYPTFSPGVCPVHMQIVKHTFGTRDGKTIWAAACCQSGFSLMSVDPEYLCTSTITTPMAFLLDPDISTADIYTTLAPELWIEHDQVIVQWEPSDLELLPVGVASQYRLMMGITVQPSAVNPSSETIDSVATSMITSSLTLTPASDTLLVWPTTLSSQTSTLSTSTSKTQTQVTTTNEDGLDEIIDSVVLAIILFAMAICFIV